MNWNFDSVSGAIKLAAELVSWLKSRRHINDDPASDKKEHSASSLEELPALNADSSKRNKRIDRIGYILFDGDDTPYCATCYEFYDKRISLTPDEVFLKGIRKVCPLCSRNYWKVPPPPQVPTFSLYRKSARQRVLEFEHRLQRR
jgi:hypothetical protein